MRLQVLQEELEAQRARARGESTEAWGVNRTDEDKDVVRATQAQMNYADSRPTGGKNRFTLMRRRAYANEVNPAPPQPPHLVGVATIITS